MNTEHFTVRPDRGDTREFKIRRDKYGVTVQDEQTGVCVTLDWSGNKMCAVINDASSDDPRYVVEFDERGLATAVLQYATQEEARE